MVAEDHVVVAGRGHVAGLQITGVELGVAVDQVGTGAAEEHVLADAAHDDVAAALGRVGGGQDAHAHEVQDGVVAGHHVVALVAGEPV